MEKWDEFSQNKQAIVAVAMALTTTCLIFLLLRFLLAGASLEIVQLSITLVGVGAASLLAIVAMRRQRSNEITVGLDEVRQSSERIASLRGRFVTAAEAIGSDSKAVQFAGAYAMANLADEWLLAETDSREAQTCVNVLCAYLRQQGDPISEGKEAVDSTVDQVEETILKSIASRVRPKEEKERGSWSHLDFDFGGGTFSGARFMEGAVFVGTVSFAGSRFTSVACRK